MTYTNVLFMARGALSVRFLSVALYRKLIPCRYIGAGAIAFAIRSGVNLVLLLARIKNLPKCVCIPCSNASQHAQTYILLGKCVSLSYGMHSSDQILSAPLP
jgi:hypothetical protein